MSTLTTGAPADTELEELLRDVIPGSGIFAMANVIMQLSRLPVGRGVAESTVDSGRLERHPLKRARTTTSYLIVALLGDEHERAVMRREINRAHRAVRSPPGHDVAYNAFDPELQLWVAACIYVGFAQWLELFRGPLTQEQHDRFYRHASRLATTLQVPEDRWPADRDAFGRYWDQAVTEIEMDDVTRKHLRDLTRLRFLPWPLPWLLGPGHRFMTVGFLPPPFREELHESWGPRRQRLFDAVLRGIVLLDRLLPTFVRRAGLVVYERDVRRRIATGRPIV